jgi:outer membrane protein assembly factor BamA
VKLAPLVTFLFLILAPVCAQIKLELCIPGEGQAIDEYGGSHEFDDSLGVGIFLQDLISDLHSKAYLAASVDSISYSPGKTIAWLNTGKKYNHVYVSLGQIDNHLLRLFNLRPALYQRQALSFAAFRNLQKRLLSHYENSGYPFAASSLSDLEINGDTIRGNLVIEKNRRYHIDSIHIYGNAPVEPRFLYRHLGIHPGDPYSEEKFRSAGQVIRETGYLSEIRAAEMEFMSESADLYLYLDRLNASSFNGILGIIPGGADHKTRLAGELNLNLVNAFRRMETISLQWHSPGNNIQQMDLELGQPYLFGRAFGIDVRFHMYRQDSTWLNVEAEAGVPFSIPGRGIVRVFGKTLGTSIIANGTQSDGPDLTAAEVSGQVLGLSYRHGRVDSRINPYRGWLVRTSVGAGNKKVTPPPGGSFSGAERKTGFGEGMLQLHWFVPVTPSSTIMLSNLSAIKLNLGSRENDYFFANEMYLLGGLHSIRGFDERSLAASAYSIQRIEYRYLLDKAGNIFMFFDGMAYRQKLPGTVNSDLPFGFGGGLTFDTRAGQFSVSYALGRQQGNPLSFRSAKVHMGITSRF